MNTHIFLSPLDLNSQLRGVTAEKADINVIKYFARGNSKYQVASQTSACWNATCKQGMNR